MKAKRLEVVISFSICITTLIYLIMDWLKLPKNLFMGNSEKIYDFAIGVFSGTIVVFIISLSAYQVLKKENISNTLFRGCDYVTILFKFNILINDMYDENHFENYMDLRKRIEQSPEATQLMKDLMQAYDNWFYGNYWYYPILKYNKINMKVIRLQELLSEFNRAINYIDLSNNYIRWGLENDEEHFSNLRFLESVQILIDDAYIDEFKNICDELEEKYNVSNG